MVYGADVGIVSSVYQVPQDSVDIDDDSSHTVCKPCQ